MEISAKISYLVRNNHVVTAKQLCCQHDPAIVKESLIKYGMANQQNVACLLAMEDKSTQQLTTGYFLVKDVVNIINSHQFDITQIIPYAAFDETYSIQQIIAESSPDLSQKVGKIIPRKLRTRHNKIQAKQALVKKVSQTHTTTSEKIKNNKQDHSQLKNQETKNKIEKKMVKEPVKTQIMPLRMVEEMKNQNEKGFLKQRKKPLKVESESGDEEKILSEFKIQGPVQKGKKIEPAQDNKIEEEPPQQQQAQIQKQEGLDLDFEDAFEALLKKKKNKVESKVENKNLNLPDKLEKKTTEKVTKNMNSTPSTAVKASQNQVQSIAPKASGQGTLFSFMKKK